MFLPRALTLAFFLLAAGASPRLLEAQDTTAVAPDRARCRTRAAGQRHDSGLSARLAPCGARSSCPGWGQARLNRKLTGGIFIAWEGVTLGMTLKTRHELDYLRRTGSERADSKRQEHEDWLVLLAFNHVFAALEAYVGAHLADFPGDLRIRAMPGAVGASLTMPRLR